MIGLIALVLVAAGVPEGAEFQRVLGGPELDRGVFVSPTLDGGYICTGVTRNGGAGGEDVLLMKLDPAGVPEWTVTHGGPEDDNGWSVHETEDGYIIAGYTQSSGAGGFDFYLLATDAAGALRWSRTYGGEEDDRCWALLPTADGGFALAGETFSRGAGAEDFLLIKTDALGQEEWSRTYGGAAGDRCFSIAPADDGGFVLAGQTYSEGAGERDAFVIRTDSQGNEVWRRTFGGEARDVGHCVSRTRDGHYLITGYTASFAASAYDPYLIKLSLDGETLWTRVPSIGGNARAITGAEAADGGLFLVGFRNEPARGASAALLVRTDAEGQLEWFRDILRTTSGQSFGYTVRATADGGCVFAGHTTVGSAGELDVLMVRVVPSASAGEDLLLQPFVGSWEGHGKLFGADATFRMEWEWVLGDKFLHLRFENRIPNPDGADRVMQAQAFYRPSGEGKLEGTWFDSRGVAQPLQCVVETNALTTRWGTPETEQGRTVYRLVEDGRIEVEDFIRKGDEWHPFAHASYGRVRGKP